MKRFAILGSLAALALVFAPACGDDDDNGNGNGTPDAGNGEDDGGTNGGFEQPEGTVPIYFSIDATARPDLYEDGDLEWKGNFSWDEETRILTPSSNWCGDNTQDPMVRCVPLYDDGPWDAGGHEPEGATAGDDIFGIAVFLPIPTETTGAVTLTYGAQNAPVDPTTAVDGGWIWVGDNGVTEIPVGQTDPVTAEGLVLEPLTGTVDLKLTLDTNNLGGEWVYAGGTVTVKGTFSSWTEDPAFDDGSHGDDAAEDGIFTYVLSEAEAGRALLESGETVAFVWVINAEEYKTGTDAEAGGVAAYTMDEDETEWSEQTLTTQPSDLGGLNTAVVIP